VSVVVPFAGGPEEASRVYAMLTSLQTRPGDELILSDNSAHAPAPPERVQRVIAAGERSPGHARNRGAAQATGDWILFLDADVQPPMDLIERFFAVPIAARTGAVTGDIAGVPDTSTLAARYATARNFLGQRAHVNHPLRPRASSANLLVRRAAFVAIGGYTEGILAAEDTDLIWRLAGAGWGLEFNEQAVVHHAYRTSLRALGRQWRGYAAGARWLSERYPDFKPDPGLRRGLRLLLHRFGIGAGLSVRADGHSAPAATAITRRDRILFLAVQVYLAIEEQIGLRLSNAADGGGADGGAADHRRLGRWRRR
jgi:glycosyltransferase involved in cell wall biosynthesis